MARRITHALIALLVALTTVLPAGVCATPVPDGLTGTAAQPHCRNCAQPEGTGTNPDKMPTCQVLACADAVATLPNSVSLSPRFPLKAVYSAAEPTCWTVVTRAPDPFPPRPTSPV